MSIIPRRAHAIVARASLTHIKDARPTAIFFHCNVPTWQRARDAAWREANGANHPLLRSETIEFTSIVKRYRFFIKFDLKANNLLKAFQTYADFNILYHDG